MYVKNLPVRELNWVVYGVSDNGGVQPEEVFVEVAVWRVGVGLDKTAENVGTIIVHEADLLARGLQKKTVGF